MEITMISGPSCLYIYHYEGKKYFFFGDVHGSREGSCHELGYKCDAFNYNFTQTTNADSNCTTIGALLTNWFAYNNKNNIKTDFYLEEFFTQENIRSENTEYDEIISKRGVKNIKSGAQALRVDEKSSSSPFHDKSWMQMTSLILSPCFMRDKMNCPYYPNVHMHYIDVRVITNNVEILDTTPFSIDLIHDYVQLYQPLNIPDLIKLRDEAMEYINYVISNYKILVKSLLSPDGYDHYMGIMKSLDSQINEYMMEHTNLLTTTYDGKLMFRTGKELYRLSQKNYPLYEKLVKYIYQMVDKALYNIQKYEKSIEPNIKKYNQLKSKNGIKKLRTGYNELLKILEGYELYFIDLQSVIMDVYTLSRLFIQDGEEIIVYAGVDHIKVYMGFFNSLTFPELSIDHVKHKTCLMNPKIPNYIDALKYK